MLHMNKIRVIYTLAAVAVYALVWFIGNGSHSTEATWQEEAAPWLGEAPAGLQMQTIRATTAEELPCTEFSIPADAAWQQKIIATYQLEPSQYGATTLYTNTGVLPVYPNEQPQLPTGLSPVLSPRLIVQEDGSMLFYPNDPNAPKDETTALRLAPPFPQYLPQNPQWEIVSSIILAVLCFMLPGVLCCAVWLWVQRRRVADADTNYICYALPALVAFVGAYTDFFVHGFDSSYSTYSALFSVATNMICAFALVKLTQLCRGR